VTVTCPICKGQQLRRHWKLGQFQFLRCSDCLCVFSEQHLDQSYWNQYYNNGYHRARGHGGSDSGVERAKRATFRKFYRLPALPSPPARLLEVGCGTGDAIQVAHEMGFECVGVDISNEAIADAKRRFPDLAFYAGKIEQLPFSSGFFDVIALFDAIEHFIDAHSLADALTGLLAPNGRILIVTPNMESLSAKILGPRWFHAFSEHVLLYCPKSLAHLLKPRGFTCLHQGFAWKWITLDMLFRHSEAHRHIAGGNWIRKMPALLPSVLREMIFPFNIGEFYAIYQKKS